MAEARTATAAWRQKLPAAEVPVAAEQAKGFERSFFAWLQPAWWRLRRILNESYDFRRHVVRPRWSHVLGALQKEYDELAVLDRQRQVIAEKYRLDDDVDGAVENIRQLRQAGAGMAAGLARVHSALVKSAKAPQIIAKIVEADEPLGLLVVELAKTLRKHEEVPLDHLCSELKQMQGRWATCPRFCNAWQRSPRCRRTWGRPSARCH